MDTMKVCVSNLCGLQERRYSVVYLTVTRFVRTVMRLILCSTPRHRRLQQCPTERHVEDDAMNIPCLPRLGSSSRISWSDCYVLQ
uniref:Uncharacterized protein n=1 Tax=Physcomitrium patens TaxID=3218 RepID=A0A2K1JDJ7_PHYPA|nr:hypothetical protein PHYPA_019878 [Physcomitrium patens]